MAGEMSQSEVTAETFPDLFALRQSGNSWPRTHPCIRCLDLEAIENWNAQKDGPEFEGEAYFGNLQRLAAQIRKGVQ